MRARAPTVTQKTKLLALGQKHLIGRKHFIKIMNFYYMGQKKEDGFTEEAHGLAHIRAGTNTHTKERRNATAEGCWCTL